MFVIAITIVFVFVGNAVNVCNVYQRHLIIPGPLSSLPRRRMRASSLLWMGEDAGKKNTVKVNRDVGHEKDMSDEGDSDL